MIGLLVLALYLAVAITAFIYVGRWYPSGPWRPVARASVIAVFFSMGLFVGHGVAPAPALVVFLFYLFSPPEGMPKQWILWLLAAVLVQWLILVALFSAWAFVRSLIARREEARIRERNELRARQRLAASRRVDP
jgi:hypothetical protein